MGRLAETSCQFHLEHKLADPKLLQMSMRELECVQGAAKKSSRLIFFAVFSATAWNFNLKFYIFIYYNLLHLNAM